MEVTALLSQLVFVGKLQSNPRGNRGIKIKSGIYLHGTSVFKLYLTELPINKKKSFPVKRV